MSISRISPLNLLRNLSRPPSLGASRLVIRRSSSQSRTWQDLRRRAVSSHLLAGALGGSVVIVGGYAWYHFSPIKSTVEALRRVRISIKEVRTTPELILEKAREKILVLAKRSAFEVRRVKSEVLSRSSVSRTIKEKAAWLRRSIRRDDSKPSSPEHTEEKK
ncbi:hypothetical protein E4T56_gene9772 [Termitomyces sp. T112]|nr:hypothetical protein E4T56_gene9772 [Termitomyces sp. T112]